MSIIYEKDLFDIFFIGPGFKKIRLVKFVNAVLEDKFIKININKKENLKLCKKRIFIVSKSK